jgi:hypothetical protein
MAISAISCEEYWLSIQMGVDVDASWIVKIQKDCLNGSRYYLIYKSMSLEATQWQVAVYS